MGYNPKIENLKLPTPRGVYETDLYRGAPNKYGLTSDYDKVIVLAPGWLGSRTLKFAAKTLAQKGHDVAVVAHDKTSWRRHNKDRAQNVHYTARAASAATGKREVILAGHSHGNHDVHNAAIRALQRQEANPSDDTLYIVKGIGSLAGAGLNGKKLVTAVFDGKTGPMKAAIDELYHHPQEEVRIVAESIGNFARNPLLSILEGVSAATCDVRPHASRLIGATSLGSYVELYCDDDIIIKPPSDRADVIQLPGTHLSPVINPDLLITVADALYLPNNPKDLSLAKHAPLVA